MGKLHYITEGPSRPDESKARREIVEKMTQVRIKLDNLSYRRDTFNTAERTRTLSRQLFELGRMLFNLDTGGVER